MAIDTKLALLRSAGRRALEAQDELASVWKHLNEKEIAQAATPDDSELLCQLILRRIYPTNAFAALANVSPPVAQQMLLARYLGKGVDPDTKFGGFSYELSSMLDDFYMASGERGLRELVRHPQFDRNCLDDPRVVDALSEALKIRPEELPEWLRKEA
jgi:hypothetical protein